MIKAVMMGDAEGIVGGPAVPFWVSSKILLASRTLLGPSLFV
jgi:hypothetical protein